ncbi:glycosyltransferase family protein [Gloeobacter violaceus]|uniref:Glr1064 protein n=1 Tax=Gloeobacter violaceus (strain ATCC 29082 / PCC 7421) TaxID=251221 RepID=Q7NLQ7_GLOVI|nr:glycosyltransferase [Gloeobacter violaceus]BAC89005.1 glr1064 [Gloeobacter violaceus PCC 7421]
MKKKLLFYCQHILGMGHLVRSMEIVRGLADDFQVCFINGGEQVPGFEVPAGIEVINLPAIKTDAAFRTLTVVGQADDLEAVQAARRDRLLAILHRFAPDALVIELFPFGRRRFSFELVPLLEAARAGGRTKVICSLRDIVVTKQDQAKHEQKVCQLMNRYFDLLLVHGDPRFQPLEETFSRVADLTCPVHYTGYVVQQPPPAPPAALPAGPLIVTSIGGGRFGHELIASTIGASGILQDRLPHRFAIFCGPFMPEETFERFRALATSLPRTTVERYTPHLLSYLQKADLSISMSGYNTTMNVLTTGVRAMLLAFTGNDDLEQTIRSQKLEDLGVVARIHPEELLPERFARKILACLEREPTTFHFDLDGVARTAGHLRALLAPALPTAAVGHCR